MGRCGGGVFLASLELDWGHVELEMDNSAGEDKKGGGCLSLECKGASHLGAISSEMVFKVTRLVRSPRE